MDTYTGGGVVAGGMASGGGALALTGGNPIYMILAAFAFIAVGAAILRIVPRVRRRRRITRR